jgi:hypothetical protein
MNATGDSFVREPAKAEPADGVERPHRHGWRNREHVAQRGVTSAPHHEPLRSFVARAMSQLTYSCYRQSSSARDQQQAWL